MDLVASFCPRWLPGKGKAGSYGAKGFPGEPSSLDFSGLTLSIRLAKFNLSSSLGLLEPAVLTGCEQGSWEEVLGCLEKQRCCESGAVQVTGHRISCGRVNGTLSRVDRAVFPYRTDTRLCLKTKRYWL